MSEACWTGPTVQPFSLPCESSRAWRRMYGASSLLPITRAHIDGVILTGAAGLAFAERLADLGGQVAVPTTLNVMSMDRQRWRELNLDADFAERARRLGQAYVEMGARPTFTCAPYQTEHAPSFGEQIAWSESNAVAFANSVIGARTNRYGDYLDICCALTGRAPITEFAKATAFDSDQAICSPKQGMLCLIGSAGECRLGAHPHVRLAQAMSTRGIVHTQVPIAPALAVHRHDVEGRGHGDLPTEIRQPLGKIEPCGTS